MLTVGSLFSGIGGFDLGLERAGMRVEWQVENNEWCREVLKKHWPKVPCHYDITQIDWRDVPRVDLICGGFPCQPFSVAGHMREDRDDRSLWPVMFAGIKAIRPSWVIGENVAGAARFIQSVCITDLETIGYQVRVYGIPACAVGADHYRKRLWIIAHTEGEQIPNSNQGHSKQKPRQRRGVCSQSRRVWDAQPGISRVADGLPHQMDRLRGLGNAIVPQIAEMFGRMILEVTA